MYLLQDTEKCFIKLEIKKTKQLTCNIAKSGEVLNWDSQF